jgi:hypothetical protein
VKHSPLEKLPSALAAWVKQACESKASMAHRRSSGNSQHFGFQWMDRFKKHKIVYNRSVNLETVEDWNNYKLLQEIEGYDLCDIYNADETGLFFNLQPNKTFIF